MIGSFDASRTISANELQRFQDLRASGNPQAPQIFDAEGIVQMHNIQSQSEDSVASRVAGSVCGIYDRLSPMPDSTIPMASLLRSSFTILAPGLSPACSPAIAMAKIGATAVLEKDIPLGHNPAEMDQFRDYIGLGAVHAVSDLSGQDGDWGTQSAAQQALNQYQADASVPGNAHNAAIHLVNFLSSQAQRA
jgi:hypothetical protein